MVECSFVRDGRTITYKVHRKEYDEIQALKEKAPEYNSMTEKSCKDIMKELEGYLVTTRAFKNLTEGLGRERTKPRNYLCNEVVVVSGAKGEPRIFFWGDYSNVLEAENDIIDQIKNDYVREQPKPEPEKRESRATARVTTEQNSGVGEVSYADARSIGTRFGKR